MSLSTYQQSLSASRYKGEGISAAEVLQTAALIAGARADLSDEDYEQLREASGINPKVWSKLLQIGQDTRLPPLVSQLPPSYTTIHGIHCLTSSELQQALDDGAIRPTVAMAVIKRWLQEVRQEKDGGGALLQAPLLVQGPLVTLQQGRALSQMEWDELRVKLEELVGPYEIKCLYPLSGTLLAAKRKTAQQRACAIGETLLVRLQKSWSDAPEELKSLFRLNSPKGLVDCSLQTFTGFYMKLAESRDLFWQKHGSDYILKIALEFNKAPTRAQRFNYKRRLLEIQNRHSEYASTVKEVFLEWIDL